jgi:hypothetical protein
MWRENAQGLYMADVPPTIFLDFDDVICLNSPYGGYDVMTKPWPDDLWEQLFAAEAKAVLLDVLQQTSARVVVTTSWLRFLERPAFETLFRETGLASVVAALHPTWEAPEDRGMARIAAIDRWLSRSHAGEPYVVIDDEHSGTGLKGSRHDKQGRVVLCAAGVGLRATNVATITAALRRPCRPLRTGLVPKLAQAVSTAQEGHDPFCRSILRGGACDCGYEKDQGRTSDGA